MPSTHFNVWIDVDGDDTRDIEKLIEKALADAGYKVVAEATAAEVSR